MRSSNKSFFNKGEISQLFSEKDQLLTKVASTGPVTWQQKCQRGTGHEYSVYGNLSTKEDNKVKREKKKRRNCPKICLSASVYASSLKPSTLCAVNVRASPESSVED